VALLLLSIHGLWLVSKILLLPSSAYAPSYPDASGKNLQWFTALEQLCAGIGLTGFSPWQPCFLRVFLFLNFHQVIFFLAVLGRITDSSLLFLCLLSSRVFRPLRFLAVFLLWLFWFALGFLHAAGTHSLPPH
jgi:hypothetical protein